MSKNLYEAIFDALAAVGRDDLAGDVLNALGPVSQITDGNHSFAELYSFRALYNAHAVRGWLASGIEVTRSWKHHDGEPCFGGGWFVVVAQLPSGQISNHYPASDWNLFAGTPETECAPIWDGHDAPEAARRLRQFLDSIAQGWMCPHCNDHFGPDDDDMPPVCLMCRKAGRS